MVKYDNLDARSQLEQEITKDLKLAFEKRGFTIKHNGTDTMNASGGKSDIEMFDSDVHINVEVTKTKKSSSDREFLSIKDHLENTKRENSKKKCFVFYVSPETHYRMINAIKDTNILNARKDDMKIIPICFKTFELIIEKLKTAHKEQYQKKEILRLFDRFIEFINDEKILRISYETLFSEDKDLGKSIDEIEENKHQQTVTDLIKDLLKLEDNLREYGISTHNDAIKNVIFLVFIKLYEEKREFEGKKNRFRLETFGEFQTDEEEQENKMAIHKLFERIKNDQELKSAKLLTDIDLLSEKLNDDYVIGLFLKPFEKYHFYTTKVDGVGSAYEVLGLRSGKDVKAGQFFTPENVVRFMIKLAELTQDDVVLDPACGTGRFLVYAMEEMINKVDGRNKEEKIKNIKTKQLYGTDFDANVAKLAKMNMYIHGDGKTNILDEDGLLLYKHSPSFDSRVDVILTNPPLGDLNYNLSTYDNNFKINRMEVIQKINVTEENLKKYNEKLEILSSVLDDLTGKKKDKLLSRIKELKTEITKCEIKIKENKCDYRISGNQMKGGALFMNACKDYLKDCSNKDELPEWRGGKILIILDEGLLNTDNYKEVRDFIKKYFYIKAIISLTKDAFVPVSRTPTKTSILYAIKKEDITAKQQEPIFFAHAEKVGLDTKKRVCENYLFNSGHDIISRYRDFKKAVLSSYDGLNFKREKFEKLKIRSV
jgi:type I restriction-modification system DNA methylase subunit